MAARLRVPPGQRRSPQRWRRPGERIPFGSARGWPRTCGVTWEASHLTWSLVHASDPLGEPRMSGCDRLPVDQDLVEQIVVVGLQTQQAILHEWKGAAVRGGEASHQ